MYVWVTGAKGLVGSSLLQELNKASIAHFGTTRQQVELTDESQVMACMQKGVTHIVNTAGLASVEAAEIKKEQACQDNVISPYTLAKAAKIFGAKLIHLSTDYVFDGAKGAPYLEEDSTYPLNWYGKTKREGEERIEQTLKDYCILRISRVFGGQGREFASSLLHLMQTQETLSFASDQRSRPTYVIDLAKALIFILQNNLTGLYHYANQGAVSKYEFASTLWHLAQEKKIPLACKTLLPVSTAELGSGVRRPLSTVLDTAKIEKFILILPWETRLSEYFSFGSKC